MILSNSLAKGFGLMPAVEVFQNEFERGAAGNLERFIDRVPSRKWMAFSDYVFYDPKKRSDVIVVSLVPWTNQFDAQSDHLQKLSFKDIKSLSRVNPEFIAYLRQAPIFNVAVMLPRHRQLAHKLESEAILAFLAAMTVMVEEWCTNLPENQALYRRYLKDFKHIERLIKDGRAKLDLVRDSILVASIVGYVMFRVAKLIHTEKMGWFSDRDSMLDYQSSKLHLPLVFQLMHTYYHVLCTLAIVPSYNNPFFAKPEKESRVSYDSYLRISDLIAGTLSDLNLDDMSFSHPKFRPVLDGLLKTSDTTCVFQLTEVNAIGAYVAARLNL